MHVILTSIEWSYTPEAEVFHVSYWIVCNWIHGLLAVATAHTRPSHACINHTTVGDYSRVL